MRDTMIFLFNYCVEPTSLLFRFLVWLLKLFVFCSEWEIEFANDFYSALAAPLGTALRCADALSLLDFYCFCDSIGKSLSKLRWFPASLGLSKLSMMAQSSCLFLTLGECRVGIKGSSDWKRLVSLTMSYSLPFLPLIFLIKSTFFSNKLF